MIKQNARKRWRLVQEAPAGTGRPAGGLILAGHKPQGTARPAFLGQRGKLGERS